MRGILATLLLLSGPALGAGSAELAAEAEAAHSTYCADVATGNVSLTSQAVARVATIWDRVTQAGADEANPFLLYWRGKLGECLTHDDLARADYSAFLTQVADAPLYSAMAKDARRRLKRLEVRARRTGRQDATGGFVLAGLLGGVGGGLIATSAGQYETLLVNYSVMLESPLSEEQYRSRLDELERQDAAHQGLLAAGTITAVVGISALIVSATVHDPPTVIASPTLGGVAIAGRF